jgi:bla regulator protein blaR1
MRRLAAWRRFSATTVCAAIACMALAAPRLGAQILHATGPLPSFEVATIKLSSGAPIPSLSTPAVTRIINVTARNLIEQAYRIPWTSGANQRVLGGPGWIDSDHYDVEARIEASQMSAISAMSNDERKDQTSLRIQSLLAERLRLKLHFESRELPIYTLVVAKGGPKLVAAKDTASDADQQPPQGTVLPTSASGLHHGIFVQYRGQQAEMTAKGATLDQLVHWLAGYSEIDGRTIVNQTGLAGTYDFTLHWTREQFNAASSEPSGSAASLAAEAPALFTSLSEQLGLRLVPGKGPVEVLVIDHVERPSEN